MLHTETGICRDKHFIALIGSGCIHWLFLNTTLYKDVQFSFLLDCSALLRIRYWRNIASDITILTFCAGCKRQSTVFHLPICTVVEQLWCRNRRKIVRSHPGITAIRRLENSLCQPSSKRYFFELEQNKKAKGEKWAPRFIRCALDTVGL